MSSSSHSTACGSPYSSLSIRSLRCMSHRTMSYAEWGKQRFLYSEEGCSCLRLLPSSQSWGTRQISNRASKIAFHFGVCLPQRWSEIHLQAWGVHCGSIKLHHSSSLVIILLGIPDNCQLLSIIALLTRNWTTCMMCSLRTCRWYNERGPTLLDGPRQRRFPCWKFFFPKSPLSKIKAHLLPCCH